MTGIDLDWRGRGTVGSSRGRSSSALADPSNPLGESNDSVDLSYLENVMVTIMRLTRDRHYPPMVNYKKGGNSVAHLRYSEDPRGAERSSLGDARFWFPHQADWYESMIMTKKHVTTEMKWIDWAYLKRLATPVKEVVNAVYDRCQEMDLVDIMSFTCNWNEEVVALFYATLFVKESGRTLHWVLGGKQFTYNMAQFSTLFGHTGSSIPYGSGYIVDNSKVDLHESNELEPSRCISCMIEHMGISSMGKSRVSLLSIDCSTLCFGSLSLQEGVTLTTYPLELRTC